MDPLTFVWNGGRGREGACVIAWWRVIRALHL